METKKTPWQAPELEVLDVQQTMAGYGFRQIDWIEEHDADLYDPSSWWSYFKLKIVFLLKRSPVGGFFDAQMRDKNIVPFQTKTTMIDIEQQLNKA